MRQAEVIQCWAKLANLGKRPTVVRSVSYSNMRGLADAIVEFEAPITVLCGLNGVGKSSFLRLIWSTIDWDAACETPGIADRLKDASVETRLLINDVEVIRSISAGAYRIQDPIPDTVPISYLDPAVESVALQKFFGDDVQSVPDLINGVDPITLPNQQVEFLKYITGKDYSKAEIFEIDSFGERPLPYFRVQAGTLCYDLLSMSLGEISCMLLLWRLNLLRSNAVLLLEEPETYISPIAQQSLMDVLVYHAVQRRISFIITSHSPKMVKGLAPNSLKFFVSSYSGSRIVSDVPQLDLLRSIGLETPKRFLLLVEDRVAREILSFLLSKFARTTLQESEILGLAGASNIEQVLNLFPRATAQIRVVGVYDGDMKSKIRNEPGRWSATALPFDKPPEEEFRALISTDCAPVANVFGISEDEVLVAHSSLAGKDMHDWLEEFGRGLGRNYETTVGALMTVWLTTPLNNERAKEFCSHLQELLLA